ncbi:MAG: hydrogen peroxide-inducible genes activator [Tannerella sp.]|jgi:LysR family hydrogen peroxide-inducible transcriptional activator|nr:hydrogen peroxide-inducible genes activator [Tannerella sp.]
MNIQQLEYVIAVDRLRHFANAAEACYVTQPTLSMMIRKLEEELDVQIFDRSDVPVKTTKIGRSVINQAEIALKQFNRIKELVEDERQTLTGIFALSIIPTIAPYLVPELLREKEEKCSECTLVLKENITSSIIANIRNGTIDGGLMSTPLNQPDLVEYPIYYEKFYAYIHPSDILHKEKEVDINAINIDKVWLLENVHCFRGQIEKLCRKEAVFKEHQQIRYQARSINTLINVVDHNSGITVIPEMAAMSLSEEQQENLREFKGMTAVREVSLVVSKDFIRLNLLNTILGIIRETVPKSMKNPELKKFVVDVKKQDETDFQTNNDED